MTPFYYITPVSTKIKLKRSKSKSGSRGATSPLLQRQAKTPVAPSLPDAAQ